MNISICKLAVTGILGASVLSLASSPAVAAADLKSALEIVNGDWQVTDSGIIGSSPRYRDLPGTQLGSFADDAHTYFVVHAVNLWRYALLGSTNLTDYTIETRVKILNPAPLNGIRPGQDCVFINYQWGREAMGSDAAIVVRHAGPDQNYMVRLSTGYGHLELWKTKGGVVRVIPFPFVANTEYQLAVTVAGHWIVVAVDGKELIRYCDNVDPIETGKAGVAVRESKVQFTDIRITPVPAITAAAPAHKPNFKIRPWVGRSYIFDGDEPIAHFANRPDMPLLEEVKLAPGVMPFCTLPGSCSWGIDWKTNIQFRVARDGGTLAWTWALEEKNGNCTGTSTWTLTYDSKVGYIWDHKAKLTALTDDKQRWGFDLTDPCFYQTVAPATSKMPTCRTHPNYALWQGTNGQYYSFLANHQCKNGGGVSESDRLIKLGGFWATTVDDWAAVFELPNDNPFQYVADYCHWGLDQHISPSAIGVNGSAIKAPAKKGAVYEGHIRVYPFTPAKLKELLAKSVPAPSVNPAQLSQPMLVHEEPINHFSEVVNAVAGDSKLRWLGRYTIDRAIGHGDSISMRIAAEDAPWLEMGSSYRTGPYTGLKYRIGFWVKADDFKGKVSINAKDFNWPGKDKVPEQKAELEIDGKCDWTHVSFETDFPRLAHLWKMLIDVHGKGAVWVDDVEIVPLDPS